MWCEQCDRDSTKRLHFSGGHDVRSPGQRIDRKQRIGCICRGQLCIGSWNEEAGIIQSIKALAIQRGYADAEVRVAQRRLGENGVDAVRQCIGFGDRMQRGRLRCLLRIESRICNENARQRGRKNP